MSFRAFVQEHFTTVPLRDQMNKRREFIVVRLLMHWMCSRCCTEHVVTESYFFIILLKREMPFKVQTLNNFSFEQFQNSEAN